MESSRTRKQDVCSRLYRWFTIDLDGNDPRLIGIAVAIAFISGMVLTVFALEFPLEVFNQPGQILRLTTPLSPSGAATYAIIGTAAGCFGGAALIFGQLGLQLGWIQKRAWQVASMLLQAL